MTGLFRWDAWRIKDSSRVGPCGACRRVDGHHGLALHFTRRKSACSIHLQHDTSTSVDTMRGHTTLHNHTLGKFLVTFGDVQATDEVLAKLGCAEQTPSSPPLSARLTARR